MDILSQLIEASWRGITFPTQMVDTKGGHNVVQHKRVDRDGWRVENTGRNGYVFSFKIPFINSIAPGPEETWSNLYPDTYTKMISACEDRSSGEFIHPEYGQRNCKVETFETTLDPDFRGGPTMTVTLWESVDDDSNASSLTSTSVISEAYAAAADLDAVFLPLTPPPDTGTPFGLSLAEFIRSIGSIADEWELFKMQWTASINKVVNAMEILEQKFGGEPGFSDKTERLISALRAFKNDGIRRARPVSHYIVPKATTLPSVALRVGSTLPDLLKLNPTLARGLVIPAQTAVAYYG